ncbi:FecR family protein [Hyphomonas sp.]|uniref:FecR family protein n=1 Tax=Hyphomonas sp. TaxID=87 RepID=UPI003F6F8CF0
MTCSKDHPGRLGAAARWYSDLQDPDVSIETWEDFLDWEGDPHNAAAFREIEASLVVFDRTTRAYGGMGQSDVSGGGQPTGSVSRLVRSRTAWIAGIAAALVLATVSVIAPMTVSRPEPIRYATSVGEQRSFDLADGSVMTLNTDTEAKIEFTGLRRYVRLVHGQALFEVEKEERPFIVEAGSSQTTALGTVFDVYANAGAVEVTLLEGSVVVAPLPDAPELLGLLQRASQVDRDGRTLVPGEKLVIRDDGTESVSVIDPSAASLWQSGSVWFDDMSLLDVVTELNRYARVKVRIDDPDLGVERLSGGFRVGEEEEFVGSLVMMFGLEAEQIGNEVVLSHSSPAE